MLQHTKSSKIHAYKYALVLPLLVFFVLNFNTEIVAQTKESQSEKTKTAQNVLKYVITKDTKDTQLESIKEKLLEKKAAIHFEDIQRNERHELIDIKINYEHDGKTGVFFRKSENPIVDITISLNVNENELSVGETKQNLSQTFAVLKEDGETKLKKEEDSNVVIVFSKDDEKTDETVKVIGKDGDEHTVKKEKTTYVIKSGTTKDSNKDESVFMKRNNNDTVWIKSDVKNIVWTDDDGNVTQLNASEGGKNTNKSITQDIKNPLIIFDGKKIKSDELDKINPETIASVNLLVGDEAFKSYGEEGNGGVVIVSTKAEVKSKSENSLDKQNENDKNNIKIITNSEEQPLIFLDGKEISKKEMETLEPESIKAVNVLKGEKAIAKYGKKAEHGVIEITSKIKN